uniref:Uncharacterized protein n=1 Tax=Chromera velia CCMP2878 TaxID=1169474 RepID=A0A0G4GHY9_9ALVE|eukprot:Cvel_21969.t1-p1 / transcript=Cvel_21969.t1 / gene=Cvel_21969 / organism=Chromera_velia_CCMP2878 / gene_product=hypothetical protein / transcript_product=hypothetical protein / location=Cvel_scaffold2112:4456-11192(+) / protein_length=437 / sequence_SO=supercontig / SO=protein_coding / is_pseudo=false
MIRPLLPLLFLLIPSCEGSVTADFLFECLQRQGDAAGFDMKGATPADFQTVVQKIEKMPSVVADLVKTSCDTLTPEALESLVGGAKNSKTVPDPQIESLTSRRRRRLSPTGSRRLSPTGSSNAFPPAYPTRDLVESLYSLSSESSVENAGIPVVFGTDNFQQDGVSLLNPQVDVGCQNELGHSVLAGALRPSCQQLTGPRWHLYQRPRDTPEPSLRFYTKGTPSINLCTPSPPKLLPWPDRNFELGSVPFVGGPGAPDEITLPNGSLSTQTPLSSLFDFTCVGGNATGGIAELTEVPQKFNFNITNGFQLVQRTLFEIVGPDAGNGFDRVFPVGEQADLSDTDALNAQLENRCDTEKEARDAKALFASRFLLDVADLICDVAPEITKVQTFMWISAASRLRTNTWTCSYCVKVDSKPSLEFLTTPSRDTNVRLQFLA